ncbi:MAG: M50 family metallopeptidase [Planctomycetaceae bacterium]|nr:M50 family metallopeptidase [Planctomycetaceae bacterium]
MQYRDSLYDWAFPCGTWFGIRVRFSPLFLLVPIVLGIQRWDARLAALVGLCLVASVLLHELAHVFAIRLTGGVVNETLLWPLGGLTRVSLVSPSAAPVATALAGPLMSLLIGVICLSGLMRADIHWKLLDPLSLPETNLETEFGRGLLAIFFYTNWLLVAANILPALPFDGGRVLDLVLSNRFGPSLGQQTTLRAGIFVGCSVIVAALLSESVWLCALGAGVVAFNLRDSLRHQIADNFDESFMGYDFSQGYTSLERSVPAETEVRPGLFQRWLARRRACREERQRMRALEAERELDFLLAKVHTYGINSLTDSERRTLKRASTRYRGRAKD